MKYQRGGISLIIIVLAWLTSSILIACSDDERDDEVSAIRVEDSTEVLYSDGTLYYRITSTSPLEVEVAKADRNVVNVRIPEYVRIDNTKYKCTSISAQAFYNSEFLKSVYIPNTVESIGSTAFRDCYELVSITLGSSVTHIGSNVFGGCEKLTSIHCRKAIPEYGVFYLNLPRIESATLYVPKGSRDAYLNTGPWSNFKNIVEE